MIKGKKIYKLPALIVALCLLFSLVGCTSTGNERYRVVTRLSTQKLGVAFRLGDKLGDTVSAALAVVQAEGTVSSLSRRWLKEDRSKLKGNANALDELEGELSERTLLVGYDKGHMPYSGQDKAGEPIGFDIDFARAVCETLGWKVKFIAVDVGNAEVELKSGNVDCVWGGYAIDESNTKIAYSPVYMENTVVVASLTGSGVSREGNLSGKTLAVSETGQFYALINEKTALVERLEYLVILPGSADDCFTALHNGSCDAIVTDLAAIEYWR